MSRVDDVSAAPADDGPAATDEPRTTTTTSTTAPPDQSSDQPSALERALEVLGIDEAGLDEDSDTAIEGEAQATAAGVNPRRLRQLRLLKSHADGLKAQHEDLTGAIADLEREVVRDFGDAGVQSLTIDGYTAHLRCRTWVGPADGSDSAAMCAALIDAGSEWAWLAPPKYHSQQLSSHVNALDEQGKPIPDEIEAVIKRTDKWGVGFRKAAQSRARGKRVPTSAD